jgi:hypothetical protein
MLRFRGACHRCREATDWIPFADSARGAIERHVESWHEPPEEGVSYAVLDERQCDYCETSWNGTCRECHKDFCTTHKGFRAGLCINCSPNPQAIPI